MIAANRSRELLDLRMQPAESCGVEAPQRETGPFHLKRDVFLHLGPYPRKHFCNDAEHLL